MGALENAIFALMGLVIAFTFSGAAARYELRRDQIAEEANDIGTAYLRLDLLSSAAQPELRDSFKRYVEARLAVYRKIPDMNAVRAEMDNVKALQDSIWSRSVAACREAPTPAAAMLLLPALNAMIDIATTRTERAKLHPPAIVFVMLGVLAMVCSLFAGIGMAASRTRSWFHIIGFAAAVALTVYVILDLEFPRIGFIRLDAADQVLQDARDAMK